MADGERHSDMSATPGTRHCDDPDVTVTDIAARRCAFCDKEFTAPPAQRALYCCRSHRQRAYEARRIPVLVLELARLQTENAKLKSLLTRLSDDLFKLATRESPPDPG